MQTKLEFIRSLAKMRCIGAYKPIGSNVWVGCGRCPSCLARREVGFDLPPHKVICEECGLTALEEDSETETGQAMGINP